MDINYLAVLISAIAYMVIGAVWYSPVLFGNAWMKAIGKTKEQIQADFSPLNYLWGIITAFIASYGIARIMLWSGVTGIGNGIKIALVVGICFALATMWVNDSFEKRPKALTLINVFYHLVGFVVAGIIIGTWQ
jgi:hypothetical protein